MILPLAAFTFLQTKHTKKIFVLASFPIILLGFAQYMTNSSIVPTTFSNTNFSLNSLNFQGHIRAFSLFSSGLSYGHYLAILEAILIFYLLRVKNWHRALVAFTIFVVFLAGYTTLTRNVYLEMCLTLTSSLALGLRSFYRGKYSKYLERLILYLPFLNAIATLILIFYGLYLSTFINDSTLLNDESLAVRYSSWEVYLTNWMNSGINQFIFGIGLAQGIDAQHTQFTIDNSFLAVAIHIGLAGLILWLIFMWKLWVWIVNIQKAFPHDALLFAIASFWCTWISTGFLSILTYLYPLLAMIALSVYITNKNRSKSTYATIDMI